MKYLFLLLLSLLSGGLYAQAGPVKVQFYCTNWGSSDSWDVFCGKAKAAGYNGVETWLPGSPSAIDEMNTALAKHQLELILLCGGNGKTFEEYAASFGKNLQAAIKQKPVLINCHTGKEYYSFEQIKTLVDLTTISSRQSGIPIVHETHRGRFTFAAHITADYLRRLPELRLTLDISHWFAVHESQLDDQPEAVELALSRTLHIHSRVGHPEGPQVNDPRAPEWQSILNKHLRYWDKVIENARKAGLKQISVTPEFGPPDYMPTLPYTRMPLGDQWAINKYMMDLLKSRYN